MFGRILNMSLVRAYRLLHLHYWYLSLIFLLAYTFLSLEINLALKKFNTDCNGLLYVLLLLGSLFYRNTNSILQCFMLLFGFTRNGIANGITSLHFLKVTWVNLFELIDFYSPWNYQMVSGGNRSLFKQIRLVLEAKFDNDPYVEPSLIFPVEFFWQGFFIRNLRTIFQ